jgi:hypothetical protein
MQRPSSETAHVGGTAAADSGIGAGTGCESATPIGGRAGAGSLAGLATAGAIAELPPQATDARKSALAAVFFRVQFMVPSSKSGVFPGRRA